MGWVVIKRDWVLIYGLGCYYTGLNFSNQDGVLVYGMWCSYTGCSVSIQDGVLKNRTGY